MLDKLYKFLENRNKPFTITEIFKNTDIDKTKEND